MFITLEGIEGSGKTTQAKLIAEKFKELGRECIVTREPGGTRIGQKIRAILLDPENKDLDPTAELLFYMADRAQHVNTVIKPALTQGKVVLCDRFFDAGVVYQGYVKNIDIKLILKLHELVFDNLKPDITFLLDLPVSVGLDRVRRQKRDEAESRFDVEDYSFHEKVRQGYSVCAASDPERWTVINAAQGRKKIAEDIWREIPNHFLCD